MVVEYYSDPYVRLLQGDVLEVLSGLPDASVQCVVTSPPYLVGAAGLSNRHMGGRRPGLRPQGRAVGITEEYACRLYRATRQACHRVNAGWPHLSSLWCRPHRPAAWQRGGAGLPRLGYKCAVWHLLRLSHGGGVRWGEKGAAGGRHLLGEHRGQLRGWQDRAG